MEAIQSLGIDWKLLVAQIINFVILLFILRKFLYTPILKMLDKRKVSIEEGIESSREAETKLAMCNEQCKKISQEAINESGNIVASAKKLADAEAKKIVAEAQKKSQKIVALAEEDATNKKEGALREARKELADLVMLTSEKVLGKSVDESTVGEVIAKI